VRSSRKRPRFGWPARPSTSRSGVLAEREAADAREELALREELGRRAVELNDEVVQGLALSGYLLSAGDAEAATPPSAQRSDVPRSLSAT